MSCKRPLIAIKTGKNAEGKNLMYFPHGFKQAYNTPLKIADYASLYGKENIVLLPCGHCIQCKLAYSRTWSYRCMLEASCYKYNCFLTLTFDDDHLPADNHVHKRDLQLFLKRLRKEFGEGIRFFGCGEYGKNNRPHYHLILFNFWPTDAHVTLANKYLVSDKLNKLWPFGFITIGECTLASCAYVARYCTKKIFKLDDDSFVLMSRRPGLGFQYFQEHYESIYKFDFVYSGDGKAKPSRYYDSLLEKINPDLLQKVKDERLHSNNELVQSILNDRSLFDIESNNLYDDLLATEKFKNTNKKL